MDVNSTEHPRERTLWEHPMFVGPEPASDREIIDSELQQLREWIPIAASSLNTFYIQDSENEAPWYQICHLRRHGEADDDRPNPDMGKKGHTSSLRAFYALHEYVRWLNEEEPLKEIKAALADDFVT